MRFSRSLLRYGATNRANILIRSTLPIHAPVLLRPGTVLRADNKSGADATPSPEEATAIAEKIAAEATKKAAEAASATPDPTMSTMAINTAFDPAKLEGEDKETYEEMVEDIKVEPVLLFMKGTPSAPLCQHSRRMIDVLRPYKYEFLSYDVLHDKTLRDGVKHVSKWPTLPQLFVGGKFVGGVDVVAELSEAKELEDLFIAAGAEKMKDKGDGDGAAAESEGVKEGEGGDDGATVLRNTATHTVTDAAEKLAKGEQLNGGEGNGERAEALKAEAERVSGIVDGAGEANARAGGNQGGGEGDKGKRCAGQ